MKSRKRIAELEARVERLEAALAGGGSPLSSYVGDKSVPLSQVISEYLYGEEETE